jgi:sulfonate transport system permease protein
VTAADTRNKVDSAGRARSSALGSKALSPTKGAPSSVRRWLRIGVRAVGPVLSLALWWLLSVTGVVPSHVLPSPGRVVATLDELSTSGALWDALTTSLQRAAAGLLIGGSIGLVLGILTGLSAWADQLVDSSLQMFRMIPFIALTPLFLVWFGIGEEPKIALVAVATVFSVYLNTAGGVRGADSKLVEAARVLGVGRLVIIGRLILPQALPTILLGFRYAMGVSLLALVAAEQINASAGIGYLVMVVGANSMRTDVIVAGIIVYAVLGIVIDVIMRALQYTLVPWARARR